MLESIIHACANNFDASLVIIIAIIFLLGILLGTLLGFIFGGMRK